MITSYRSARNSKRYGYHLAVRSAEAWTNHHRWRLHTNEIKRSYTLLLPGFTQQIATNMFEETTNFHISEAADGQIVASSNLLPNVM